MRRVELGQVQRVPGPTRVPPAASQRPCPAGEQAVCGLGAPVLIRGAEHASSKVRRCAPSPDRIEYPSSQRSRRGPKALSEGSRLKAEGPAGPLSPSKEDRSELCGLAKARGDSWLTNPPPPPTPCQQPTQQAQHCTTPTNFKQPGGTLEQRKPSIIIRAWRPQQSRKAKYPQDGHLHRPPIPLAAHRGRLEHVGWDRTRLHLSGPSAPAPRPGSRSPPLPTQAPHPRPPPARVLAPSRFLRPGGAAGASSFRQLGAGWLWGAGEGRRRWARGRRARALSPPAPPVLRGASAPATPAQEWHPACSVLQPRSSPWKAAR